ncbi:MAG TPA: hypothetical protein VN282_05630 [Pyrinomonadaceae bacterium]|nr:hypothetical protein [Pyrinomonadaceae bacterium]
MFIRFVKRYIKRIFDALGQSSTNLAAGLLIYAVCKGMVAAGYHADFFKSVLYEHLTPRSLFLFLGVSLLLWTGWTLLTVVREPRYETSGMFLAANWVGRYDQFVFSLYCTAVAVYAAAFLSSLAGVLAGNGPRFRYAGAAAALLLLSLFLPTFWLRPDREELPSRYERRVNFSKGAAFAKLTLAILLLGSGVWLVGNVILDPVQFVIE